MGKMKQTYMDLGASEELAGELELMRQESASLNSQCLTIEHENLSLKEEIAQLKYAIELFKEVLAHTD